MRNEMTDSEARAYVERRRESTRKSTAAYRKRMGDSVNIHASINLLMRKGYKVFTPDGQPAEYTGKLPLVGGGAVNG